MSAWIVVGTMAALSLSSAAGAHSSAGLHRQSSNFEIVRREHLKSTTVDSSLGGVCTPSECIQGKTSLQAGVLINTPINITSRNTVLLPGTYTTKTAAVASGNTSLLDFSSSSTTSAYAGFSDLGAVTSPFTVTLQAGVVSFPSPLYEGDASFVALSSNATAAANATMIESVLLSEDTWVVLSVGGSRVVVWESVPDVGEIYGGTGGVYVQEMQSSTCSTPCASGGTCLANATCACAPGWTGATCHSCASGYFGTSCTTCASDCATCDDGITGSGLCLDTIAVTDASACDCVNGICSGDADDVACSCNAGWYTAANGTQCAACAEGYYETAAGDCRACDASCAACSAPSGICVTCKGGLAASAADSTACVTATTALNNGTFVACPDRTYYRSSSQSCEACDSLCETCFGSASGECLRCRTPYVLVQGQCVAFSSSTGLCDSDGVVLGNGTEGQISGTNAVWVYDNDKQACDAIPAKCTAGSIPSFTSSSAWSDVSCSSCLAGYWLSDGDCVASCPTGSVGLAHSTSCQMCNSSCLTCSLSTTYCASCTSGEYLLNGTCVSACGTGFFSTSANSSCSPCHPDCASCSGAFDTCTSCESDRPVLTASATCVPTCASDEYLDGSAVKCEACDLSCATCSGRGSGQCLSCSGAAEVVSGGACVATSDGCGVMDGFGLCLSALVTVDAKESASGAAAGKSVTATWWEILLIILAVLAVVAVGVWRWRKKEQARRRKHTKRFGDGLDKKEVEVRLRQMPAHIAYPKPSSVLKSPSSVTFDVPLTPRLPTHNAPNRNFTPARVPAPSYHSQPTITTNTNTNNFVLGSPPTPSDHGRATPCSPDTAWSVSSAGAAQSRFLLRPELEHVPRLQLTLPPQRLVLVPQGTGLKGVSGVSGGSTTSAAFEGGGQGSSVGGKKDRGTRNPFR